MTPLPAAGRSLRSWRNATDPRFRLLIVLGVVLAVADQLVKRAVVWFFDGVDGSRRVVVDGFFDLLLTRNPGAAFSMLADLEPDWLRVTTFIVLSCVAIVFIFYYASKASPTQRLFLWGLGCVLGGAVGNLIDRIYAGRVIDFLEFYSRAPWLVDVLDCRRSWGCRFPAFNVADIAINVGVGLLLLDAVKSMVRERRAAKLAASLPPAAPPPGDVTASPAPDAVPTSAPVDAASASAESAPPAPARPTSSSDV